MSMKILGTLGFHEGKFLPAVLALPDVREVHLYSAPGETEASNRASQAAVRRVQKALAAARIPVHVTRLPDPYAIARMLPRFIEDLRRLGPKECVFNVTGGTKAMAVAAALACLVTGTRAVYVPEDSDRHDLIDLPLPALAVTSLLTPGQARVLGALDTGDYRSESELAKALRLAPATVSYHLGKLRSLGAVRWREDRDGRVNRAEVTDTGRVLLQLQETLGKSSRQATRA